MGTIGRNPHGGSVLAAAMEHAASEDKVWIARAALQEPELLACLAQGRQGDDAVQRMLQALSTRERARACDALIKHAAVFGASKLGHLVAEHAEALRIAASQAQQRGM